jgi:hypothetical protein
MNENQKGNKFRYVLEVSSPSYCCIFCYINSTYCTVPFYPNLVWEKKDSKVNTEKKISEIIRDISISMGQLICDSTTKFLKK